MSADDYKAPGEPGASTPPDDAIDRAWDLALAQVETARKRRIFRRLIKARVSSEQNHRCCYCGVRTNEWVKGNWKVRDPRNDNEPTLEHVVPLFYDGPDTYENCVMACRKCNSERGREFLPVHHELLLVLKGETDGNDT